MSHHKGSRPGASAKLAVDGLLAMLVAVAHCVFTLNAGAQGYVKFDNLSAGSGLVYVATTWPPHLLDQDASFQLFGGPLGSDQLELIHSWLVIDGSARSINVGPGLFADPGGLSFAIPGVGPGQEAWLEIRGWVGNYATFEDAIHAASAGAIRFRNHTGDPSTAPGLTVLPDLYIGIPEPGVSAILGLGSAIILFRRRSRAAG